MGARSQTVCYPTNGNTGRLVDICTSCNSSSPNDPGSCATDDDRELDCEAYCNANPNTVCDVSQAYCNIGHELIQSHADVHLHPSIACTVKDELIFRNWTSVYWNSLQDNLLTADRMGKTKNCGFGFGMTPTTGDPCNDAHPPNSLVTAAKYNEVALAYRDFFGSLSDVAVGDVIRGAQHAGQIVSQYPTLKFKTDVCDICNTTWQADGSCGCNCSCSCACSCSCPCSCSCDCSCSCSCGST